MDGVGATMDAQSVRDAKTLIDLEERTKGLAALTIDYPLADAVFPPGFPPPTFLWHDSSAKADAWLVVVRFDGAPGRIAISTEAAAPRPKPEMAPEDLSESARKYKPPAYQTSARRWMPSADVWNAIKQNSVTKPVTVTVIGFDKAQPQRPLSRGAVTLRTSVDPVGAPIFYRDVPLPFVHAFKNTASIRWRLGDVRSDKPAPTLLENMKVCGNCHSFTPDGKTLAMDVDYGSDKGSYIIAPVEAETLFSRERVISWSDYRREDGQLTFGLLAQISPDGRHVVGTVKDRSVFSPIEDIHYSQRFFPVKGILAVYDREAKTFAALRGADDASYVQSNPSWSPDGKTVVFARGGAYQLKHLKDPNAILISREEVTEFFEGGKTFRYDLWRTPFNGGKGGEPEPVPGASANGKSNYFAKYSPDGKWIVFCQARTFMLLQPDSLLHIMPAEGGEPRQMRCNLPGKMNSWHSWSPNGRWLVFASKANGPFTQLWLAHVDADGASSRPVVLEHFTAPDRAANIPEFVNVSPERFAHIRQDFADYYTHFRIGLGHERRKEHAEAIVEFRKALEQKPDHVDSMYVIASCLARMGREAQATPYLRRTLKLEPDHLRAHRLLGALLGRRGQYAEAVRHMEIVLKGNPQDAVAANNLAWVLATCPVRAYRDGARAVKLAEQACKTTGYRVPMMLDSLAAAYAETGKFQRAVMTAKKVL
ncbi:PD40 domain-containing protein, partial [bacterium]|nr:PD40 domain-containing protein [bacterium]